MNVNVYINYWICGTEEQEKQWPNRTHMIGNPFDIAEQIHHDTDLNIMIKKIDPENYIIFLDDKRFQQR